MAGAQAPLSPREEITLRRIGLGVSNSMDLRAGDVDRLARLSLIERRGSTLVLTEDGMQRYLCLPKGAAGETAYGV